MRIVILPTWGSRNLLCFFRTLETLHQSIKVLWVFSNTDFRTLGIVTIFVTHLLPLHSKRHDSLHRFAFKCRRKHSLKLRGNCVRKRITISLSWRLNMLCPTGCMRSAGGWGHETEIEQSFPLFIMYKPWSLTGNLLRWHFAQQQ
jgi:hypothetical protein